MAETSDKNDQLIVRQRPAAGPDLDALLQTLQAEYNLDAYTARQRLIGPGLALFGKGCTEQAGKISALLHHYGFACWLVEPQAPDFAPRRLRSLEIQNDMVQFDCEGGPVRMERGRRVVGVLADLSGNLADKHVKRLLAQNTYRGQGALQILAHDEIVRAIYRGTPIYDFYLLCDDGVIEQAVRVLRGRFNIDGLGSRAGLSTLQNLEAVVELVEEYAGDYRRHVDFGLSQLPQCQVRRLDENAAAVMENLDSLTRYGWLVARLQGDGRPAAGSRSPEDASMTAAVAATATIGQPALGAVVTGNDAVSAVPGLDEGAAEMQRAFADDASAKGEEAVAVKEPRDLPPPPDMPDQPRSLRRGLLTIGGVLGGFTLAVGSQGGDLLRLVAKYSMTAGVIPAVVAVFLFLSGFHFIRLKRRVENTPTSKVRSIAMGMVEVHGRARRLYALVAPMTQSACAWYRLRKYRKDSKDNWQLVKEVNSHHVPFQIDDGTGRVTVNPRGSSVKARIRQTGYPGQSPLTFTAFGRSTDEDEKWVEDIIYEGTSLYVLGYAQPLRDERPGLRERTMAKLRQLKLDPQAMRRYDTDGDGHIDETEWSAARSDAEQQAMREHLADGAERKRQEEHVIIAKPPQRGLPFVIAEAISEAALVRKYGLISIPLLLAGTAATALALYKFLQFVKL